MRITVGHASVGPYITPLVEPELTEFRLSVASHLIEYEVNPATGGAVPVKIDGFHVMSGQPKRGEAPDWLREKLGGGLVAARDIEKGELLEVDARILDQLPSEQAEPGKGT